MKNYLLGIIFLVLAFYLLWQQGNEQIEYAKQSPGDSVEIAQDTPKNENDAVSFADQTNDGVQSIVANPTKGLQSIQLDEEILTRGLQNELSSFVFSNHSGAIVQSLYINLTD